MTTTASDIDTMPAGKEMDAAIDERVMEQTLIYIPTVGPNKEVYRSTGPGTIEPIPNYSTDWGAAALLKEKLRDLWTEATSKSDGVHDDFEHPFDDQAFFEYLRRAADHRWPWALLYIEPVDICRAALKAVAQ